ncbi:MAG: hypothetical protein JNK64_35930 [Myxococcales bacterium]|nr:hypothetical protein [Myxococcales bacterium]
MRILATLTLLVLIALALARSAAADRPTTIAVIPLQADRRLALYGAPVASELATALERAGFEVVLVSDVAVVPSRAWLVVDGRLVAAGKAVTIELRIRDPERAVDVTRLAARASTLASIDAATRDLAADLTAALAAARPVAPPPPDPLPHDPPPHDPGAPHDPIAPRDPVAPPPPPPDPRPHAQLVVRGKALHDGAGAPLDVAALTRPALARLADRLGYVVVDDPAAPLVITAELTRLVAGFEGDVPVGRGRARVIVSRGGEVVFDRLVRTDTVVGSRGDRVDTVVRLVAAQAADVVLPRVRERLEATP